MLNLGEVLKRLDVKNLTIQSYTLHTVEIIFITLSISFSVVSHFTNVVCCFIIIWEDF